MTKDIKEFKDKFDNLATKRELDIAQIHRSSLKRILTNFENTDYDYARFFNDYSPKEKAEFLINIFSSDSIPNKYHEYMQDMNRTKEIDYRNFSCKENINYNDFDKYIMDLATSIKDANISADIKTNNLFILNFLFIRSFFGNPTHWMSNISFTDQMYYIIPQEIMFIGHMSAYVHDIVPLIYLLSSDEPPTFHPYDVFLELLNCTLDEILCMINSYFDSNFLYLKNYNDLSKKIKKLNIVNTKYHNNTRAKHSDFDLGNCILTVIDSRNLRDKYFESLSSLKNSGNFSNESDLGTYDPTYTNVFSNINQSISFTNNIKNEKLIKYISESNISIKGFNKHRKIIVDLTTALQELKNDATIYSPNITIDLDFNKLIDFKVLYHEFFTLKNDYSFKINSTKQINPQTVNLVGLIKMIILTANNYKNFLNDKDLSKYGKDYEKLIFQKKDLEYKQNEDSNLIYNMNILLGEKIRRGYYREFDLMKNYRLIFDYKISLRKTLTQILSYPTLEEMYNAVINLYNDIFMVINDM